MSGATPVLSMKIIDKILYYISVPKCIGCGEKLEENEKALCRACFCDYENQKNRQCSKCFKILSKCSCSNEYVDAHFVHKLVKVFRYSARDNAVSNMLVYSLKRDNRKDVLDFLSDELAVAIKSSVDNFEKYIVTSVPRRKKDVVKYGFDHAELLARTVSDKLGVDYLKLLRSKSKVPQKKTANKEERIKNANFELKKDVDLSDFNVIIVDDVVTTGASIGAVAMNLKSAGAKKIVGAALCIAYKDKEQLIL